LRFARLAGGGRRDSAFAPRFPGSFSAGRGGGYGWCGLSRTPLYTGRSVMGLFLSLGLGHRHGQGGTRKAPPTPPRYRPLLERLEDRLVPTVSVLKSFAGMNFNDTTSGGEPPDTIVAAGPNHVVECVNTAIRVYDKSG